MKSILFAAACAMYEPGGNCETREVHKAETWEGPTAPLDCDAELMASRRRLQEEGLGEHFVLWCDTSNQAE